MTANDPERPSEPDSEVMTEWKKQMHVRYFCRRNKADLVDAPVPRCAIMERDADISLHNR